MILGMEIKESSATRKIGEFFRSATVRKRPEEAQRASAHGSTARAGSSLSLRPSPEIKPSHLSY
jgi:hypothetical protein